MTHFVSCIVAGAAGFSLLFAEPAAAGLFGGSVVGTATCKLGKVTARKTPAGGIAYSGVCNFGGGNTGEAGPLDIAFTVSYGDGKFNEAMSSKGRGKLSTSGNCDSDPWLAQYAEANCSNQQVLGSSDDALRLMPALLGNSGAARPPYTLAMQNMAQMFADAAAHASRPNPPNAPVKMESRMTSPQAAGALVSWMAPDESRDRPWLSFVVQWRPAGAVGAPWTTAAIAARGSATTYNYKAAVKLPAQKGGVELRTCSTTKLDMTCTGPQQPAPFALAGTQAAGARAQAAKPSTQPAPQRGAPVLKTSISNSAAVSSAARARGVATPSEGSAAGSPPPSGQTPIDWGSNPSATQPVYSMPSQPGTLPSAAPSSFSR